MDTINTHTVNRGSAQGKLHQRGQWKMAFPLTCALLFGAHSAAAQSVELVKDINVGKGDASPEEVVRFDGRMFFRADDGVNGAELWASDGTEAGTTLIKDINPGNRGSNPHGFTVYDNRLYFAADDGNTGQELWVTDGTTAGTERVEDINPGRQGSRPSELTVNDGKLYFQADDGKASGSELRVLDAGGACALPLDASKTEVEATPFDGKLTASSDDQTGTYTVQSGLDSEEQWVMFPAGSATQSGQTLDVSSGTVGTAFAPEKIPESDGGNVVYSLQFYDPDTSSGLNHQAEVVIAHSDGTISPKGYYVYTLTDDQGNGNFLLQAAANRPDQIGVYFDAATDQWGVSVDGTDYGFQSQYGPSELVPVLNVNEKGGSNAQSPKRQGDPFVGTFVSAASEITAWMPSSAEDPCSNPIE